MPELHTQLAEEGAKLLMKVIKTYPQSFEKVEVQNEDKVTYGKYRSIFNEQRFEII